MIKYKIQPILLCLILATLLSCCAETNVSVKKNEMKKPNFTLALDGKVFEYTHEVVDQKMIDIQIGEIKRIVSPVVEQDGDFASIFPDGKMIAHSKDKIYSLKNKSRDTEIACEVKPNTYFKCVYYKNLK